MRTVRASELPGEIWAKAAHPNEAPGHSSALGPGVVSAWTAGARDALVAFHRVEPRLPTNKDDLTRVRIAGPRSG